MVGQTAVSRAYDGGYLTSGSVALAGVVSGDSVGVTTPNARFVDKNVGTAKAVNLTGIALTGADAGNYVLAPTVTGDITAQDIFRLNQQRVQTGEEDADASRLALPNAS